MRLFLCLCWSAVLSVCQARAATYVVDQSSPTADDRGPGSAEAPLRTINAAAQKAQAGDRVLIQPGIYREVVRLRNSGTAEQPITFQAAQPGQVIISGADVIQGWRRRPGDPPIYVAPWNHDFIGDRTKTGIEARIVGSNRPFAPVYCAELFVSQGKLLRQVMQLADLAEGKFFVNWDTHQVYVLLPGSGSPDQLGVEGCARQTLFSPVGRRDDLQSARYIHVKGLTFRHAANWAQQPIVHASFGWVLEDCVFEASNSKGLGVRDETHVIRCVAQDNGQLGFGAMGKNIVFQDCITRRNNWKGFEVGWESGGGKWAMTDNLVIDGMQAYGNYGLAGIWLDNQNRNYRITNCVCYDNDSPTQGGGLGIFTEINPGPGVIANNICYSNANAGIGVGESADVVIEGNLLVANGRGVYLRAMPDRQCAIQRVTIRNNRFKDWRESAIGAGQGPWTPRSAQALQIQIENNLYDAPAAKRFSLWGSSTLQTLAEAQQALGTCRGDALGPIAFERPLAAAKPAPPPSPGIEAAFRKARAKEGDTVVVPVFGRNAFQPENGKTTVLAYDLHNRWLELEVSPDLRAALEKQVPQWPGTRPIYLRVRLVVYRHNPPQAVCLAVDVQP